MIERKYVEYELAKGKKDICIVCNCKNAETLNTFLCSDVRPFEEWIKGIVRRNHFKRDKWKCLLCGDKF